MSTKKKVLLSIGIILSIAVITCIIAVVVIFAKGPRDYNEDGSTLMVNNLAEVRMIIGDNAIYLKDDFIDDYTKASKSHSCGVHFEGNLNYGELQKIPIKYNKKADGYNLFFDKPDKIADRDIVFDDLMIKFRKHASITDNASEKYVKSSNIQRASQGYGMTLIEVRIENKYGVLEFTARLDVKEDVTDVEFEEIANMLIEEYKNAVD